MRCHAVILAVAAAWLIGIESAEARLDILVDKATQRMLVMQDGYMRYMWPVSTGRDELATPNGVYTPQRMERNWFSRAYYNSPMPNSIFFHNGYAIHGSYAINQLGGPASHGCVRLHPRHAEILFDLVQQEGPDRTTIEITDQPRLDEAPVPPREVSTQRDVLLPREVMTPREVIPPRDVVSPREMLTPREITMTRSSYPPPPPIVRYRDPAELTELTPPQRDNRPSAVKSVAPPRPPVARRMLTDLRPPATIAARTPCGAGESAAGRPPNESSDCRAKAKVAEKVAEAPLPEQAQQTQKQVYGFKLLPSSCWSGGASRWRWWGLGREAPCK